MEKCCFLLNDGEVKEQYQVTIKNSFLALENLDNNGDINTVWDAIRENIKILAKESTEVKHHKLWFDSSIFRIG
jgi:hypothetical protein